MLHVALLYTKLYYFLDPSTEFDGQNPSPGKPVSLSESSKKTLN